MNNLQTNNFVTKADLKEAFTEFGKKFEEKIETAIAQITNAILKGVPSKEDHNRLEGKVNVLDQKVNNLDQRVNNLDQKANELDHKVDNLSSDVSDIRRRVIDLEHDTPTQQEFDNLKRFVGYRPKS